MVEAKLTISESISGCWKILTISLMIALQPSSAMTSRSKRSRWTRKPPLPTLSVRIETPRRRPGTTGREAREMQCWSKEDEGRCCEHCLKIQLKFEKAWMMPSDSLRSIYDSAPCGDPTQECPARHSVEEQIKVWREATKHTSTISQWCS